MSFRVPATDDYLANSDAFTPQQETERKNLTAYVNVANTEHALHYKEWKKQNTDLWKQYRIDKVYASSVTHQSVRERNYGFTPPQVTARRLWDNERDLWSMRGLMYDNRKRRGKYSIDNKELSLRTLTAKLLLRPTAPGTIVKHQGRMMA